LGFAYGELPSKGFAFSGKCSIIEIKFCRAKKGYGKKHKDEIKKDIKKMEKLRNRGLDISFHILSVSRHPSQSVKELCDIPEFINVHEIIAHSNSQ